MPTSLDRLLSVTAGVTMTLAPSIGEIGMPEDPAPPVDPIAKFNEAVGHLAVYDEQDNPLRLEAGSALIFANFRLYLYQSLAGHGQGEPAEHARALWNTIMALILSRRIDLPDDIVTPLRQAAACLREGLDAVAATEEAPKQ